MCQHRPCDTAGTHELHFWANGVTEVKMQLCQVPLLWQHFPLFLLIQSDSHYCLWGEQRREKHCCHSRCTLIWLQGGMGCFHWLFLPHIWVWVVVEHLRQGLWSVSPQVLGPLQVSALWVLQPWNSLVWQFHTSLLSVSIPCSPSVVLFRQVKQKSNKCVTLPHLNKTSLWIAIWISCEQHLCGHTCSESQLLCYALAPDSEKERTSSQGQVERYSHTGVSRSLGFIMRRNCWGGCSTCAALVISSAKYRDRWVQLATAGLTSFSGAPTVL